MTLFTTISFWMDSWEPIPHKPGKLAYSSQSACSQKFSHNLQQHGKSKDVKISEKKLLNLEKEMGNRFVEVWKTEWEVEVLFEPGKHAGKFWDDLSKPVGASIDEVIFSLSGHSDLLKSPGLPKVSASTNQRSQLVICLNETSLNGKFLLHTKAKLGRAMARFHWMFRVQTLWLWKY